MSKIAGNKLVGSTIIVMVILTILSIFGGNDFISGGSTIAGDSQLLVNGTAQSLGLQDSSFTFYIDPVQGAIVLFTIMIAIVVLLGIQVLGSGLSSDSGRMIAKITFASASWGMLSALAYPLILSISIFGGILYIFLTIGYVWGVTREL